MTRSGVGADVRTASLFARWSQIVGSANADHCSLSLHDGELMVETRWIPWARQIRGLAPLFLRRVNSEMGHRTVVRIRVRGPEAPSWRFAHRHVSGRGPRDTDG